MKAPSSLREWSHKPSTGPFISSHCSTQLLQGNNFNAGTWPEGSVCLFVSFFKPNRLVSAEPQGSLLPKCLRAHVRVKVRRDEKGGTGEGCVTPSNWPELAPEWLLYMEKWKCLHNHVRKLEESTSWGGRVFLPWGISALSSHLPSPKRVVNVWQRRLYRFCISEAPLGLCFSSAAHLLSAPRLTSHIGGGGLWLLRDTNRKQKTPSQRYGLGWDYSTGCLCSWAPCLLAHTSSELGSSPFFHLLRARVCTYILSQLGCYTTDSFRGKAFEPTFFC